MRQFTIQKESKEERKKVRRGGAGGNTVPKTQYQPKSSSQSQMHSQNLDQKRRLEWVTSELLCGMIAVGWDYILAAKIFHPKRNSQSTREVNGRLEEASTAALISSVLVVVVVVGLFWIRSAFGCASDCTVDGSVHRQDKDSSLHRESGTVPDCCSYL